MTATVDHLDRRPRLQRLRPADRPERHVGLRATPASSAPRRPAVHDPDRAVTRSDPSARPPRADPLTLLRCVDRPGRRASLTLRSAVTRGGGAPGSTCGARPALCRPGASACVRQSRTLPSDDRATSADDRFDELAQRLGGFYLSWVVYLGLELGLFARIHSAGGGDHASYGSPRTPACAPGPVEAWVRAAHASELVGFDGDRVTLPAETASVLLDDTRPEYLGGQFVAAVVSSLDYATLADFFRTGHTIPERPPRFHRAIEAVTVQDIAVFFQEGLAQLPDLAARLAAGGTRPRRRLWRRPLADRGRPALPGVVARRRRVRAGLRRPGDAPRHRRRPRGADQDRGPRHGQEMPFDAEFDLVYLQDALHELPDPVASLRSAWKAVRPGGRLVVLDWCLPSSLESQSLQAELLWGIQVDELFQGTRMYTREGFVEIFASAEVPRPTVIELVSGARRCSRSNARAEPGSIGPPPLRGADRETSRRHSADLLGDRDRALHLSRVDGAVVEVAPGRTEDQHARRALVDVVGAARVVVERRGVARCRRSSSRSPRRPWRSPDQGSRRSP